MLRRLNKNRAFTLQAFTLVELLVVIFIISVLIGILLPTLSRARIQSRRVACAAQLRDIGNLYRIYLIDSKDRMPYVNTEPSIQPPIYMDVNGKSLPSIYQTIDKTWQPKPIGQAQGQGKGWYCPADQIKAGLNTTGAPAGFQTYFDREGGSYQYDPFFELVAIDPTSLATAFYNGVEEKVFHQALEFWKQRRNKGPDTLVIMHDFEPFHGKAGDLGAENFLFGDFHVGDIQ